MLFKQCIGFYNTPPLWENLAFGMTQFKFPDTSFKEFKPKPIPNNIRLGHQMEYVFKQLITYTPNYEVVLHNLPIRDEKRTIGEIDFILKDLKTRKLLHVELTYKFYIIDPTISEPLQRLIGPNRRDLFFKKMEKIKNVQFPLLHSPQGTLALEQRGLTAANIEHQVCYKAQLFKPYSQELVSIKPLDMNCIVGFWLKFVAFKATAFEKYTYHIPNKSQWVLPPSEDVSWLSHTDVLPDINQRMLLEKAPMVWMRKSAIEFEKFFVVWW